MEIDVYTVRVYYGVNNKMHNHAYSYYETYAEAMEEWSYLKELYKDTGKVIFNECDEYTAKEIIKNSDEGTQVFTILKEKGWLSNYKK